MFSNLPGTQKEDWVLNETVMPVDTNNWGHSINMLTKAMPIYACTGNFYTVSSFENNVINLTPLSYIDGTQNETPLSYIDGTQNETPLSYIDGTQNETPLSYIDGTQNETPLSYIDGTQNETPLSYIDGTQNETPLSYIDGMSICFKSTFNNTESCFVNVNTLGNKQIRRMDNTVLNSNDIQQNHYIILKYDKLQDWFYLVYSTNKINDIILNKADTSLSNLTPEGEKHFLNKTQITNCLTEVPQRINYTLENGTFTLKAGSVLIVPFGTEAPTLAIGDFLEGASNNNNFKIVDIQYKNNQLFYWCEVQNDIAWQINVTTSGIIRHVAVGISSTLEVWDKLVCNATTSSAETLPSDNISYMWYQPNNNKVVRTDESHTPNITMSLPIAIVESGNGYVFDKLHKVFNGMGNIGGINWVDKGVKGLIPYYRNEDRTLKSIEFTQTELKMGLNRSSVTSSSQNSLLGIYQEDTGCISPYLMLNDNNYYESDVQPNVPTQYAKWYDTYNNIFKTTSNTGQTWTEEKGLRIGHGYVDDGVLNSSYQTVFQAADAQDIDGKWTMIDVELVTKLTLAQGSLQYKTYDISSYIPNDGNVYEVTFEIIGYGGATAGNWSHYWIQDDDLGIQSGSCGARTYTTNLESFFYGSAICPMRSRLLRFCWSANNATSELVKLRISGYRKVR